MIQTKINELFDSIKNSKEYLAYQNIGEVLNENEEVNNLVNEIKKLQQESVRLEEENNPQYKEIDKIIEEKVNVLNDIPIYKEYLRRMNEFNDIIASSRNNIEEYINSKL